MDLEMRSSSLFWNRDWSFPRRYWESS